jgi:hypothetical protein
MTKTYTKNLEKAMDVVEKSQTFFRKANKFRHIPFTFLLDHLNGKTILKKLGSQGVLTNEEDKTFVAWILGMQECGLSITLQQFKLKVVKLNQTRSTPLKDGILNGINLASTFDLQNIRHLHGTRFHNLIM